MGLTTAAEPSTSLWECGGVAVYEGFPDAETTAALWAEASAAYPGADVQECWHDDVEDWRGGEPNRRLLTAGAGPVQDRFYSDPGVLEFLSELCRAVVVPSGGRGSYSYYARPGDFLGLHRDVPTCDIALLTVLHDTASQQEDGALVVYPSRAHEPLSAIRANPAEGACLLKAAAGQTVVLAGGTVPHLVLPVAEHRVRVVSVLCYRCVA